ncbi:chromate resistance protein ChrB domain-containing protein [Rhizobium leguminosarum]|uniref:Rhodanese-related sulfurtransferase n=1 Tax=Rhizobium leguminosarum TaxID=384 RepID=A0A7W9ZMI1_RHILE|nr:sulfurtransferase/chromate resistance protein [Rhizobium leguminosarum]MBB6219378.1 rhodanese-related sulfurtransferase [Rhizobium leguminosarum]
MPSFQEISCDQLNRLIGTANCPVLIDVRIDEDFDADPRLIPGSRRQDFRDQSWIDSFQGESAVIICHRGKKLSHGVAALLRHRGVPADVLEGGFEAWTDQGLPAIPASTLPQRDAKGRTVWVTRSRPKIDRIACPWLIRRFVDPNAVFLFVAPAEVEAVADRFKAAPFDIDADILWSHRGELCTFDIMVEEFGLGTEPMKRLATIVRGADTGRPELAPEVPGLVAASLGLSRTYTDDLQQLDAGMVLYDAFYRWCRDATGETHNWPTNKKGA